MSYQQVNNINQVNIGQNYIYNGAIHLRKDNDKVYVYFDDKFYVFSIDGYEEGAHLKHKMFEYGTSTSCLLGRFMAFKLKVKGKYALYLTLSFKDHTPYMVYQEIPLEDKHNTVLRNFCFNPIESEDNRGYTGSVGSMNKDLYMTVYNKSRLLTKALPKTDYVKKAEALKKKIEECKYIPLAYKREHEEISIPGIFPQEYNKLYYISKLRAIIEDYSSAKIYFSESYKQLEAKYKAVLKYFRYGDIAG